MIHRSAEYAFFIHRDSKIKFENIVLSKYGMCCCNRTLTQTNSGNMITMSQIILNLILAIDIKNRIFHENIL